MTLKEFFRKVRRGRLWQLTYDWDPNQVRCAAGFCPLRALSGSWLPSESALRLGLRKDYALKIAEAADKSRSPHRKWLLKNLGLNEHGLGRP